MTEPKPKTALDEITVSREWLKQAVAETVASEARAFLPLLRAKVLDEVAEQMACRSPDSPLTAGELRAEAKRLRGEK